jgi:hypothetical protein
MGSGPYTGCPYPLIVASVPTEARLARWDHRLGQEELGADVIRFKDTSCIVRCGEDGPRIGGPQRTGGSARIPDQRARSVADQ